jgi:hypothetical protein
MIDKHVVLLLNCMNIHKDTEDNDSKTCRCLMMLIKV